MFCIVQLEVYVLLSPMQVVVILGLVRDGVGVEGVSLDWVLLDCVVYVFTCG